MNKNRFNVLLSLSTKRKKKLSSKNFLIRLIFHPDMFLQTVKCYLYNKFNINKLVLARTFWDRKMYVVLPEVVSSDIVRFGFIESNVARSIIKFISKNDVVIDVGAHFGFFTLLMSELVGSKGQVHSFEPIPSTYKVLRKNSESFKNIQINKKAIWSFDQELYLNDYGLSSSAFNSYREPRGYELLNRKKVDKVKVDAINLDDYVKSRNLNPKFIKIDAESTEYEVLMGMNFILSHIKPIICLEIGDLGVVGARKSKDVIKYILDYGYEVFEFNSNNFSPHKLKQVYDYGNLVFKYPE